MKALGSWFKTNTLGWKVVLGETVEHDPDFVTTRAQMRSEISRRMWAGEDGKYGYKPDLVVAKGGGSDPIVFRILDVCGGSPDKLLWEDELKNYLDKMNLMDNTLFESKGDSECYTITSEGLRQIPEEHREMAKKITSFKQVRYRRRYSKYCAVLEDLHRSEKPKASVSPVALSVSGIIPDSTVSLLKEFGSMKEVNKLCRELRAIAWECAIKAFNAWQSET